MNNVCQSEFGERAAGVAGICCFFSNAASLLDSWVHGESEVPRLFVQGHEAGKWQS